MAAAIPRPTIVSACHGYSRGAAASAGSRPPARMTSRNWTPLRTFPPSRMSDVLARNRGTKATTRWACTRALQAASLLRTQTQRRKLCSFLLSVLRSFHRVGQYWMRGCVSFEGWKDGHVALACRSTDTPGARERASVLASFPSTKPTSPHPFAFSFLPFACIGLVRVIRDNLPIFCLVFFICNVRTWLARLG